MVQNAGVDGGNVKIVLSDSESMSNEDNHNNESLKKEILSDEFLFKKLKNSIAARSHLSSIHTAKAHKYGHVQIDPKSWYKESSNISNKINVSRG